MILQPSDDPNDGLPAASETPAATAPSSESEPPTEQVSSDVLPKVPSPDVASSEETTVAVPVMPTQPPKISREEPAKVPEKAPAKALPLKVPPKTPATPPPTKLTLDTSADKLPKENRALVHEKFNEQISEKHPHKRRTNLPYLFLPTHPPVGW
jgi:hypothetical protein